MIARELGGRWFRQAGTQRRSSIKITTKGQVTIPKHVRERHGLLPGTEIRFISDGDEVRLVKVDGERSPGRSLVERMRGRAGTRLSTDEILARTRGEE